MIHWGSGTCDFFFLLSVTMLFLKGLNSYLKALLKPLAILCVIKWGNSFKTKPYQQRIKQWKVLHDVHTRVPCHCKYLQRAPLSFLLLSNPVGLQNNRSRVTRLGRFPVCWLAFFWNSFSVQNPVWFATWSEVWFRSVPFRVNNLTDASKEAVAMFLFSSCVLATLLPRAEHGAPSRNDQVRGRQSARPLGGTAK